MTKELIIFAIIALIIYWYYQHKQQSKPKAQEENWIWDSDLTLSSLNEEDWKTKYLNLELEKEQLQEQIRNLASPQQDTTLLEEIDELTLERDEAIRSRNEAQQEVLALNNLLKNKTQEISNKDKVLTQIKKESCQRENALETKIKELKAKLKDLEKSQ
jgi:predicted  nucleic acid-binding Zn-ribbon protein